MDDQQRPPISMIRTADDECFRWKVCIFDDKPSLAQQQVYYHALSELGVIVRMYGGSEPAQGEPAKLGFLRDEKAKAFLRTCHLFLVDMDWDNLSSPQREIRLPDLWACHALDLGLKHFADILEGGDSVETTGERLEARFISNTSKGFWIAAALSHLNPFARIVFISGSPAALQGSEAGALMQFRTRPVQISQKLEAQYDENIKEMLRQEFVPLQSNALKYEDVYGWFIRCVMLPVLLNLEPVVDTCGPLHGVDESTETWKLSARGFFPQWKQWEQTGKLVSELTRFLRPTQFRLSPSQRRALASVRHCLKGVLARWPAISLLDEAEKVSYEVGLSGWALVRAINKAREGKSREAVKRALVVCQRVGEASSSQLWDLCTEIRRTYNSPDSSYCCDRRVQRKPGLPAESESEGVDPPVPFDVQYLRRACEALIDNARKYRDPALNDPAVSLAVNDSSESITITYRDDSRGFLAKDSLKSALTRSIAENGPRALERGIPLALAFGFHFPLGRLEVRMNDGSWVQIYPDQVSSGVAESAGGFGVRWRFDYPSVKELG